MCEDIILHRWVPISDVELHVYIDRFLSNFSIYQVHMYTKQISDLHCTSNSRVNIKFKVEYLDIKRNKFKNIAKVFAM